MGTCLSKKSASATPPPLPPPPTAAVHSNPKQETKSPDLPIKKPEEGAVKKEIFIIKHRKSHEIERRRSVDENGDSNKSSEVSEPVNGLDVVAAVVGKEGMVVSAPVRTSSCTKEEVDAILIHCGRLSRSPSTGKAPSSENNTGSLQRTRKYSGSKRSFDFDNENGDENTPEGNGEADGETERLHRQRQRQPKGSSSPSSSRSRRRTPSRERDQATQQQRSGSRERTGSNGGGGRRVSRSPGKRSESPNTVSSGNGNGGRPGKMVSVPPTVSSLAMDKSIDAGDTISAAAVKRIQVKRNVRSPAKNQSQSLSRNNSRKAEHSPFRRNPLGEIDTNVVIEPANKAAKNNTSSQVQKINGKVGLQETKEEQQLIMEEPKVIAAGAESLKPQTVTRTRSSRLSRDLDINPEALLSSNSTQNYTALLLEDIQNFHQKNTPNTPAFSLPACVTKACSILDAVADLNSSTSSNLTENRRRNFTSELIKNDNSKSLGVKDPFMESEVVGGDDLIEPSIHKYVTLRRGNAEEGDTEDQESSGSNSFAGSQPWISSSSWEPNSSDSTSRSYSRDDNRSPLGFQRHAVSEPNHAKKRDQQGGEGYVKVGGQHISSSMVAATATTS